MKEIYRMSSKTIITNGVTEVRRVKGTKDDTFIYEIYMKVSIRTMNWSILKTLSTNISFKKPFRSSIFQSSIYQIKFAPSFKGVSNSITLTWLSEGLLESSAGIFSGSSSSSGRLSTCPMATRIKHHGPSGGGSSMMRSGLPLPHHASLSVLCGLWTNFVDPSQHQRWQN